MRAAQADAHRAPAVRHTGIRWSALCAATLHEALWFGSTRSGIRLDSNDLRSPGAQQVPITLQERRTKYTMLLKRVKKKRLRRAQGEA